MKTSTRRDQVFAPYSIYTTIAPATLTGALHGGVLAFAEGKPWTSAARLFEAAQSVKQWMVVLFSDAAYDSSRLLAWGALERIDLRADRTEVRVREVREIGRGHRTQDLLLRSTGLPIAEDFLRPYAIVHTPAFLELEAPALPCEETDASLLTLFTFGYEGCGPGTERLVRAVDRAEHARGFDPPLWVDARVSRSVRAVGFRDDALERLLGRDRYRWMRGLGNERVAEGRDGIEIRRPEDVGELLELAKASLRRRVIFFCSCAGDSAGCHRHEVEKLLVRYAHADGTRVRVIEWPGGEPTTLTLDVGPASALGRKTIPVRGLLSEEEAAAVPWGTHGILRAGTVRAAHVLLGPATFGSKETLLRVVEHLGARPPGDARGIARRWRKSHACDPRGPK